MKPTLTIIIAFLLAPIALQAAKPNVIVILADDLGWADLSCYGSTFHESPKDSPVNGTSAIVFELMSDS